MQIMTIDQALVQKGRTAFNLAALQFMCGPQSSVYETGRRRKGGLSVIPGAIVAAIEQGFTTPCEIIPMVHRVTRCWETTVQAVLESLTTDQAPDGLWTLNRNGTYSVIDGGPLKPFTVLTS